MKNLAQIIKEEFQKILQEQAQSGLTKTLRIRRVRCDFNCRINNLTSLKGAPHLVSGDFYCHNNDLTSLKGAPSSVGGNFDCHNNKLTSLEGAPSSVGGNFICYDNKLTSLEGAPSSVGGGFSCRDQKNDFKFTEEDVRKVSNVEGIIRAY
jgi:hypothetical protein